MNKEQIEKHGPVIKWFCDNAEKGIWVYSTALGKWNLRNNPNWTLAYPHIQNDEYAEYRKAQADGKVIQYQENRCNNWINLEHNHTWYFKQPIEQYRIKPDEPFKVGDWVTYQSYPKSNGSITSIKDNKAVVKSLKHGSCTEIYSDIKLWKPQEGEWCVFWENSNTYHVERYQNYTLNIVNIAPLEFIQTLKD